MMRLRCLVLLGLLGSSVGAAAATDAPDGRFREAAAHYTATNYAAAEQVYRDLLADGYRQGEVLYNLGNSLFKQGEIGEAILAYREAALLLPRDPDVAANMTFARRSTGALDLAYPWFLDLGLSLSRGAWGWMLTLGYWGAAALVVLGLLMPRTRPAVYRLAGIALLLALVGGAGQAAWWAWERQPEAVVLTDNARTRFAPMEDATPAFALPEGSLVRIEDRKGDWVQVRNGPDAGWLRESAIGRVSPWTSP